MRCQVFTITLCCVVVKIVLTAATIVVCVAGDLPGSLRSERGSSEWVS